jgi:hypothetical protein
VDYKGKWVKGGRTIGGKKGGTGRKRERGTLDGKREGEDMKGTYKEGQCKGRRDRGRKIWEEGRMEKGQGGTLLEEGEWERKKPGGTPGRRANGKERQGTLGNRKGRDREGNNRIKAEWERTWRGACGIYIV